jgi:hypothetical protein
VSGWQAPINKEDIMIEALHCLLGLPFATEANVIARAADLQSEELFLQASAGDRHAQRMLVELEFAYRVWAYAKH